MLNVSSRPLSISLSDNGLYENATNHFINIKMLTGEILLIDIDPSDTILTIKKKISRLKNYSINQQRLLFAGKALSEEYTLADYQIPMQSTLHLVFPMRGGYRIFIKTLTGSTIKLEVSEFNTIRNIKGMIRDRAGIPVQQQRLIYAGREIEDDQMLSDCRILKEATLTLMIQQHGSMLIYVKTPYEKILTVEATQKNTITDLKREIERVEGIPRKQQRLFYGDKQLDSNQTLSNYNILNGCTLFLLIRRPDDMKIFIETLLGHIIPLEVELTDTIKTIKENLQDNLGIRPDQQRLIYAGRELENKRTLLDCHIGNKSTLILIIRPSRIMQIYVKTVYDEIIPVEVEPTDTIANIKEKIQNQEGIPSNRQKLIFVGKQLENRQKLSDYNILNECTLNLIIHPYDIVQIFVRTVFGQIIPLEIDSNETIKNIKEKLQEKTGIPINQQQLNYFDKPIQDNRHVRDYNLETDSLLTLICPVRPFLNPKAQNKPVRKRFRKFFK